ncbi:hypothetical protein KI688_011012 [Linnemannia hyalina]|uniref:Uncharacterized protein n=1 Tax=Linnemannia hyalina TaxID=64524 RepID=A0A9P7XZH7_9FUNG|nr:hypothetical protein KI688_011012 [Linnemannia hyalina]
MTNAQSKVSLSTYKSLVPAKYVNRITVELQRTFLVVLSLLKTHRRKAFLLSLGPSTILKFITVILPIIKLLPPTIKAIRTLGYFTSSGSNSNSSNSNRANALANREANAATAANGVGMSMDELNEILWTPAEDMYWERVNAMVTRFGLCKTLGITLAGVRPGRVEVIMPFRTEVSGEGGAFHASLLPTLIAMTSQLTGMTLLPRHFTLKPIDFKCNILSDCDATTYLLVSRGAVVVRGDHSITVKVEILKASGLVPGSTEVVSSSPDSSSLLSWKGWFGSSTTSGSRNAGGNASDAAASLLVPGTGIERSKFVVCASGMQTSVVVRAGTDPDDEEEKEMTRLRKEREERLKRSPSSPSSSSLIGDPSAEDSIILGDSFQPLTSSTLVKPVLSSSQPTSPTQSKEKSVSFTEAASTFSTASTSTGTATIKSSTTTGTPISYAAAVSQTLHHQQQPVVDHPYEETSDTEAWRE